MSKKVFITGLGIISGLGKGVEENLYSLNHEKTGIGQMRYLESVHQDIPVSEVKHSNDELHEIIGVSGIEGFTRTALLGLFAAKEAYLNAGLNPLQSEYRTGIISGTTVGGMDRSEIYYREFLASNSRNQYVASHDCGDSTERIAKALDIYDYITTISTACSSSANAIMLAARLIKCGILDRAIAGGTDSLTKFTLNGFNTLMILDKELCKPFDENRNGLNLGEGAGYVVLESEEAVLKEKKNPICELSGYANANDAYHQTASSPDGEGAYLAMTNALVKAGISPNEIDYINAHGTATPNNDLSEGKAIMRIFGERMPKISSTKSYTGHGLGASGGIEAVFSALSIHEQRIFPNLNFSQRIQDLSFSPVSELTDCSVNNIISNSFGFGGNNTSLIFSKS